MKLCNFGIMNDIIISITNIEFKRIIMKIVKSLKSLKNRDKNCRIVKRKGRVLVINKINKMDCYIINNKFSLIRL